MFSAAMVLIGGDIFSGLFLVSSIVFLSASYIILTRNGSKYPTNLCVVGCILCAIAADVLWTLFNFGESPVFAVGSQTSVSTRMFLEAMAAGSVFFCGLIVTNIVRVKRFLKLKIALLALFVVLIALLAINTVTVKGVGRIDLPGMSPLMTDIILICLECANVMVLGALALAGRGERNAVNVATAIILASLVLIAAVSAVVKRVRADTGVTSVLETTYESTENNDIF